MLGVIASSLLNLALFMFTTMRVWDLKVVEEAYRLITEQGRSVLIVRGEWHVPYIAQELQKLGIECETFSQGKRAFSALCSKAFSGVDRA